MTRLILRSLPRRQGYLRAYDAGRPVTELKICSHDKATISTRFQKSEPSDRALALLQRTARPLTFTDKHNLRETLRFNSSTNMKLPRPLQFGSLALLVFLKSLHSSHRYARMLETEFTVSFPDNRGDFGSTRVVPRKREFVTGFSMPSPYEQRTGKMLPTWARKFYFMTEPDQKQEQQVPDVCFVHVGKTAGASYLSCG